ncbi:MAG TPA: dTDP-4-dehydrorhamnose reductase [Terracidiphilus sp.]|nr:dTDP-4-dehydrorhamnose reductase [Terracidiphilus sp.]
MSRGRRVLILGAAGQLGRELQRSFSGTGELVCFDRKSLDVADVGRLREAIRDSEPDVILNAAAYTAVDRAEQERAAAMAANADAPGVMAEEARRRDSLLVHYSTDYVFDGTKSEPWVETDEPRALNVYGESKLAGERAVRSVGGKYLTFRTSWVYGPHGKNFLLTMLRLGRERERLTVVDDQIGAPTSSIAIAEATRAIVDGVLDGRHGETAAWAGVYHMTCAGSTSWCGFAKAIFARAGERPGGRVPEVVPIATKDYPTPARRPANSVLSNEKLERRFGVRLPQWEAALDEVIARLEEQANS